MELRDFQLEVVQLAHEQNVVMVGETGIGKTFVAIALLTEQDYSDGRRAFFLAPTRQLVWQITAKIRATSTLRANAYSTMEQWGDFEWRKELALTRVFVCTPEALRVALERGFVSMRMINLLVFDECHHVTKRHPYAHVIKLYDPTQLNEMPRVFGTTACPTRDCAENLYAKLVKVEQQEKFAAIAPIQFETYEKETALELPAQLLSGVTTLLTKLLQKGRSRDETRRQKITTKFMVTAIGLFKDWGLWCLDRYIELEIERAAQNASLLINCPGTMFGFDKEAITAIMLARARREQSAFAASKRLQKIVELLIDRTDDGLQGIIFVTTRTECRVLCEYLNEKMGWDDRDRFACLLGQAATSDTASSNLPKMEETLCDFQKGAIQFLVSTAVSIEGVDFPQCAFICVADRIEAARKLIQVRGRARHQDGVIYYLAEEKDIGHRMRFQIMMKEAEAISALDFSHDKQETLRQKPRSKSSMEQITVASTGAVLDLDSSVSRLNMFCQTLPRQLFTIDHKGMFTFIQKEIARRPMFIARLQLPVELEAPIFETELVHSKSMAKASAAFLACQYLLENGLLDDSLRSVYRKRKATDDSYLISCLSKHIDK